MGQRRDPPLRDLDEIRKEDFKGPVRASNATEYGFVGWDFCIEENRTYDSRFDVKRLHDFSWSEPKDIGSLCTTHRSQLAVINTVGPPSSRQDVASRSDPEGDRLQESFQRKVQIRFGIRDRVRKGTKYHEGRALKLAFVPLRDLRGEDFEFCPVAKSGRRTIYGCSPD
jgi:hypothetical protein